MHKIFRSYAHDAIAVFSMTLNPTYYYNPRKRKHSQNTYQTKPRKSPCTLDPNNWPGRVKFPYSSFSFISSHNVDYSMQNFLLEDQWTRVQLTMVLWNNSLANSIKTILGSRGGLGWQRTKAYKIINITWSHWSFECFFQTTSKLPSHPTSKLTKEEQFRGNSVFQSSRVE